MAAFISLSRAVGVSSDKHQRAVSSLFQIPKQSREKRADKVNKRLFIRFPRSRILLFAHAAARLMGTAAEPRGEYATFSPVDQR